MPFEEIQHTADWSLRVWAADLPTLFSEAALGMNLLAGMQPVHGFQIQRCYKTSASDVESLLVAFLSELLYYAEQERIMFDQFTLHFTDDTLIADLRGWPLDTIKKSIKAVTFHNLQIERTELGVETEIVFDV
jgi:SHS2 domain-containing protein